MHAELAPRAAAPFSEQITLPFRTARPAMPVADVVAERPPAVPLPRSAAEVLDDVGQRLKRRGIVFSALAEQSQADRHPGPLELLDSFAQPLHPPAPAIDYADLLEAEMMQRYIDAVSVPRPDIETKRSIILAIFPMLDGESPQDHWSRFVRSWPSALRPAG